MHAAVVVLPTSGLRFPITSAFIKPRLGIPIFSHQVYWLHEEAVIFEVDKIQCQDRFALFHSCLLNLAEIADGSRLFASRRHLLQSALPCIRSEGNRRGRPRRNTVSGGTAKEDENQKIFKSSDGKSSDSSNQEEIIALFRRIQSSISKGGHGKIKKRNSNSSEEKQSADSVLEVLRQSKKQVKKVVRQEENKVLPRRRIMQKKERRIEESSPSMDFKLMRPSSNFVKRSPIPSTSTPRESVHVIREGSPTTVVGEELQRVEEMKLPELKELARSRGIKGYSKLKKGELVELLRKMLMS